MSPPDQRQAVAAEGALDLLVIGDCNPDVMVVGGDVTPAFGQQEKLVDGISLEVGGSASITAVAAARLGLRVALAAAVGDDPAGWFMLGQLAAEGAKYVVVTGGDAAGDEAIDAMWTPNGARFLHAPRVATRNTHGTGCTFSAAIAARLALGDSVPDALVAAKEYVTRALQAAADWQLGGGQGPLNHLGF